jgi:folylpolyglutamate synthase/dihydrofolate synthase
MDYRGALKFILQLPNFENRPPEAGSDWAYTLDRLRTVLVSLKDPQGNVPVVHVAGTKGKGSTAAMLHSILMAAGYKTGLYTSPHLHNFRERIRIGDSEISEVEFAALAHSMASLTECHSDKFGRVTTFEVLTAMAFVYFSNGACRVCVLEAGLGGRLDSTNVIEKPLVSVITSISLDHMEILGRNLSEIAKEKAGIIKDGCPVVCAPQKPQALRAIRDAAAQRNSPLHEVGKLATWDRTNFTLDGQSFSLRTPTDEMSLWIPLLGYAQLENAATAVTTCQVLRNRGLDVSDSAIRTGLAKVRWPGRLEVVSKDPLIVVDGAHNRYSAAELRKSIRGYMPTKQVSLVFGVSSDKDGVGIARELAPIASRVLACRSRHPRSLGTSEIAAAFGEFDVPVEKFPSVSAAINAARAEASCGQVVLATGSLFVAGEAREAILGIAPELYEDA